MANPRINFPIQKQNLSAILSQETNHHQNQEQMLDRSRKRTTQKNSSKSKSTLIKDADSNRQWNDIARTLFEISGEQFFRIGKHCRERWFNYLDPTKQRYNIRYSEDSGRLRKISYCSPEFSAQAKNGQNMQPN